MCIRDRQLSLCNYYIWKENQQTAYLDKAERHYDEAYARFSRESVKLKRRFAEFKNELAPMLQDSEEKWLEELRALRKADGSLPPSAGDELVRIMRAVKRSGRMSDYKFFQDQYNQYCTPQKASSK